MGVIQMAESIITQFGSLGKLMTAPARALNDIKGLGPAKRSQMLAVLELGRRCFAGEMKAQPVFTSPKSLEQFLQRQFAGQQSERFIALFLDVEHRMIACETLFKGTLTRTAVYPREIVRRALEHNAAAIIFAHNHPTGAAQPSAMDKMLTSELKKVMNCVEIPMLDHLIVSGTEVWSFRANGLC
jgi:DNA repair protein RadC